MTARHIVVSTQSGKVTELTTLKTLLSEKLTVGAQSNLREKFSSNCWNTLKQYVLQRRNEMSKRERGESRKKHIDGAWLNPKHF